MGLQLARVARYWKCRPSELVRGPLSDFFLDEALAYLLIADEADDAPQASQGSSKDESPASRDGWVAPNFID